MTSHTLAMIDHTSAIISKKRFAGLVLLAADNLMSFANTKITLFE